MKLHTFLNRPATVGLITMLLAVSSRADILELTNGDHYRGTVISMTETTLEFQSEIQGRVKLPRNKVAQITLGAVAAKPAPKPLGPATNSAAIVSLSATAPSAASSSASLGAPIILSGAPAPAASTPPLNRNDALMQQMRKQGVDQSIISQVQEQVLNHGSPEAAKQFDETVASLLAGTTSTQTIRAQAQNSINQIKSAKKDFPDASDMLDGYLTILEKFVAETGDGAGK